jgi:GT2 family glycosyltransferase
MDIELLELGRNLGWGAAHNIGLRCWLEQDRTEFCVVAADDALPQDRCVHQLLEAMASRPDLGVLCPQFRSAEIGVFSPIRGPRLISVRPQTNVNIQEVGFAHGTLTVYRRGCLRQAGLFDERYFAYGDEIELSLRARRSGWKVAQLWGAVVDNPETVTSPPLVAYLSARSSLLMAREYGGKWSAGIRSLLMIANSFRMLFMHKGDRGSVYHPYARVRALGSFWSGDFGPPRALV